MESKQISDLVKTRGQMLILYGSTQGNSARLSMSFLSEALSKGFMARVQNLADFPPEQLAFQNLVVLIVSTYGEGGPTYDAEKFLNFISDSAKQGKGIYQNLNFVIFGLGNKTYENFCGMGVQTEKCMQSLGAKNLYKLGKGDANAGTTDQDFADWKKGVWPILEKKYIQYEIERSQLIDQQLPFDFKWLPKENQHEFLLSNRRILNSGQYEQGLVDYLQTQFFEVNQIQRINKEGGISSPCFFIDLKQTKESEEEKFKYQTAGNVQIYPENDEESVKSMVKLMGYDLDAFFEIKMRNSSLKKPVPTPLKVSSYLQKFCDFHGPLNKMQLCVLLDFIKDQEKRKQLQVLTTFEGEDSFVKQITETKHSIYSFCKENNISIGLELLIQIASRIRPRNYTISSCAETHPLNIHLTVSLSYRNKNEFGIMSQQWNQIAQSYNKNGTKSFKVLIVPSPFILKKEKVPVILVATGAGIAPMRALWQQKAKNPKSYGEMSLYFGCRKRDEDYLYEKEIQAMSDKDVLNGVRVAFSREDSGKKTYVQDLIKEDQEAIYEAVYKEKAKVYLCGSQKMCDDVIETIGRVFVDVEKAPVFKMYTQINNLKEQGQIITEIWT